MTPREAIVDYLNQLLFGYYPYLCLTVFLIGSLMRFEREQYTWRASSSQILRKKQLFWGSNFFHIGILFLMAGHFVGLLTPHEIYEHVISVHDKQMLAIVSGGIAGTVCFIGLTLLLQRRLFDSRIRKTGTAMDLAVLVLLWVQLSLGLTTLPFSLEHSDGAVMLRISAWAQHIATFQGDAASFIPGLAWPYRLHLILGLTIFLVFPFSRLVHIWSAPVGYLGRRGWQIVRSNQRKAA